MKYKSLLFFKENEEGIICSIFGSREFKIRIAGMGIFNGTKIKILRNRKGKIIVLSSNTRIALGQEEASNILIKEIISKKKIFYQTHKKKEILVALAGQPNVGKSTVFNVLTGLSQHVGNWIGKTVEIKQGFHMTDFYQLILVDLPGTYSLTTSSSEEIITRNFIIKEKPNIIVVIMNASLLERNLYLVSELILLNTPLILVANMVDIAESQGIHIDLNTLQEYTGIPVISMIASKNIGIKKLITTIINLNNGKIFYKPILPQISNNHSKEYNYLLKIIKKYLPRLDLLNWKIIKLMEGDPEITKTLMNMLPQNIYTKIVRQMLSEHEDSLHAVVDGRYEWIEKLARVSIQKFKKGQVLITDRIDHLLTKPLFGFPILISILGFIFFLTYSIGIPIQKFLEQHINYIAITLKMLSTNFIPFWLSGLLIDGIFTTTGYILTFFPILLIYFLLISILEDIGYMARASFIMDSIMHKIGLHGKSFIPLCLGFSCNASAIFHTSIIESHTARLLTIFLIPFIPCSARITVLTFTSAAIFNNQATIISLSLITLNLIILICIGKLIKYFFLKKENLPFIMELPLYQKPNYKTIIQVVKTRIVNFLKSTTTTILVASLFIWILSNIPFGTSIDESFLGKLGKIIEPIGYPIGLDWHILTALIASLVAKENSIAVLGILYNKNAGLSSILVQKMNRASALSFLVILMLFIPCTATMKVMYDQMKNKKFFIYSLSCMFFISYIIGIIVYQISSYILL